MRNFLSLVIVIMCAMVGVAAQTKRYPMGALESKNVRNKIDQAPAETTDEDASLVRQTSYSYPADEFKPGVVQVGPRTTYLKEGLSTEEVVRLLGQPSAISERRENAVVVTIYEFPRSEGRVLIAEFVKNALVRFSLEPRGRVAKANVNRGTIADDALRCFGSQRRGAGCEDLCGC